MAHPSIAARNRPWSGRCAYFLLGFITILIQTLLVREALFAFHGGEVGLGAFFAMWLAGIAGGAGTGCRAGKRAPHRAPLALGLLPFGGIGALALLRMHRLVLPVEAGGYLSAGLYLVLLLVTAVPAGWLAGWLFALGLRAYPVRPAPAYALEALGSMAGGVLASLFALPRWPALVLLAATGPLLLVWAVWARRIHGRRWILLLGALLSALLVSGGATRLDAALAQIRWRALATGSDPLVVAETPHHQVTVAAREGEGALYLDGFYQGGLLDPYVDRETAALLTSQHPHPRDLLVCAPACFGPVRQLAACPALELRLVLDDPGIDAALARAQLPPLCKADREAARDRLRRERGRYDLIAILHGGPLTGSINRFYTREFFSDCAAALRPGGVLALTVPGAANVATEDTEQMRAALYAALKAVFHDVRIAPGETHLLFAAMPRAGSRGASPLTWDPDTLAARTERLCPAEGVFPAAFFAHRFAPDRLARLDAALTDALAAGASPNSDVRPFVYYEQLRRWDRLSGSRLAGLLAALRRSPQLTGGVLLAILLLTGWCAHRRWGRAALCIGSTGWTGMSMSLLLLLLFQTLRGSLYLKVGLFSGLFMAGLAAGGWMGEDWLKRAPAGRLLMVSDLLWLALLTLVLVGIDRVGDLPGAPLEALLLALSLIAGILTALPFAPAADLLTAGRRTREAAGSLADALDHGGAVAGALLTGTLLIPLLGFPGTLLLLIAGKAVSAVVSSRRPG